AAHVCGMIAGRQWANPLDEGAHLMSMSTYKSLGGPSHGLLLSNDDRLSERIDAIAFPGMTANFDAGAVAALGVTLADWIACGEDYAGQMRACAARLAGELSDRGVEPFAGEAGFTDSHQFALLAAPSAAGVQERGPSRPPDSSPRASACPPPRCPVSRTASAWALPRSSVGA